MCGAGGGEGGKGSYSRGRQPPRQDGIGGSQDGVVRAAPQAHTARGARHAGQGLVRGEEAAAACPQPSWLALRGKEMAQAVGVSYGRCFGISLRTRSSLCEAAQLPNCRRLAFYAPWPSFAGMPQVHCAPVVLETGCNYKGFLCLPAAFLNQCNHHYLWIL